MSQEIRDFFMEEAEELFDSLNSILLKNEEAGDISAEELDSIFRDMHTLKGGAGSVELMKFSGYTHHLETFMDMVRNGEITVTPEIIDFLIESVGVMQDILDAEYEERLDEGEYSQQMQELLDRIEAIKSGTDSSASQDIADEKKMAQLGENAAEMLDLYSEFKYYLEAIENRDEVTKEGLDALFRVVHTIKGSSSFLNLNFLPKYLHEIETLLDRARAGEINYNMELNHLMCQVMERSLELVDEELNGDVNREAFEKELAQLSQQLQPFIKGDTPKQSEGVDQVGFELFDEPTQMQTETQKSQKVADQSLAFELFDEDNTPTKESTPQATQETPKKRETPKPTSKESKPKKEVSLNKAASSASIRVNLDKIDNLMNRVGDLVITKSMLFQFTDSITDAHIYKEIQEKLSDLDRDIRELQESVMSVRMVPMESVYSRLPKMVRDLAKKLGKKVKFEHLGDSVEIDKMMVEGLMDPLTHIIRNSLDHGIEKPDVRTQKGKSETGKLLISAQQESGNIIISIKDDGAGINIDRVVEKALENGAITEDEAGRMSEQDKVMLVFHPGLSTAEKITDVSGRGVGMDVVMNNINALGGYIKAFTTKDRGTEFQIYLPLTLAILDGLNILLGEKRFILPLNAIVESLQPQPHMIKHVGESKREILMLRREFIPIIKLSEFFHIKPKYEKFEEGMLIVVNTTKSKVALFVDDFLNQEQIVVKSLEKNYKKIDGIGAATIRGDGSIGLILDVSGIVEKYEG